MLLNLRTDGTLSSIRWRPVGAVLGAAFAFACVLSTLAIAQQGQFVAKPLVENHWLTAAQFFRVVNPARTGPLRLRLGNPLRAPAFYLRLPMVLLLLAAALTSQATVALESGPKTVGAWLLVDTSASMSTLQDGAARPGMQGR